MKKIIFEIGERVNGTRWTVIGNAPSRGGLHITLAVVTAVVLERFLLKI